MEVEKKEFNKGLVIGALMMLVLVCIAYIGYKFLPGDLVDIGRQETDSVEQALFAEPAQEKMRAISQLIKDYCYWEVDGEQLVEGMYAGVLSGLKDPYSVYYTKEEYETILESTKGVYSGIGAILSQDKNSMQVQILKVFEGSPAEEAGLENGDIILSVGDIEAIDIELSSLVTHIKGKEGSIVHLQVKRENNEAVMEVDVTRRSIETPSVEYEMLEDNIGYIQITEFSDITVEQFAAAKDALQSQNVKSLIIDLRDNPGGSFPAVCEILDMILPKGMIVYVEDKNGGRSENNSDAENFINLPIAVLVNENSASASEIFAGAIKDHEYGTLIGTKTFGKGIVQSIVPMEDGSAVKITTAKYFTPDGIDIHEVGIEPDIKLEYEYEEGKSYERMQDNQIQKAMEILNSNGKQ